MEYRFLQDENAVELISGITTEYPYTMHECNLTDFIVPWHWHEELEFNYVRKGTVVIETLNRNYTIRQGEAYFINTNVMNTKRKEEGAGEVIVEEHLFHPILLSGHFHSIFETKYLNPVLQNQMIYVVVIRNTTPSGRAFIDLLGRLTTLYAEKDKEMETRSLLSEGWKILLEELQIQNPRKPVLPSYSNDRIKNLLQYMHHNFDKKITLKELSDYAGISETECIRTFRDVVHQTPMEYLISYRIEQAKHLLAETKEPVTNVALMTGFTDSAYFGKVFKRKTALTPTEFRSQSRS